MRILVLLTDLFEGVGGIQTFNRSFVKALSDIAEKKDCKITLLVFNDSKHSYSFNPCFNPKRVQYFSFNRSKLRFAISALINVLKTPIVIFGHVNFVPLAIGLRPINLRSKMLMILYDINIKNKFSFLQRLGVQLLNKIISISISTQERATLLNELEKMYFDILPCTLNPFQDRNIKLKSREELKLPSGVMILTVSRLDSFHRYKSIDQIIKTASQVLIEIPDAFYIIAGDGSDRKRLEKLVEDLRVQERVIFLGQVSDDLLLSYYKNCDIFVLPSTEEGFGIVFLEAMYFSKPCIGARATSIPEVIEEGKTGLLCEANNIKSLTDSIIKLLKDENLRSSLGRAGKERLEKKFSYEIFKKRLEEIICT